MLKICIHQINRHPISLGKSFRTAYWLIYLYLVLLYIHGNIFKYNFLFLPILSDIKRTFVILHLSYKYHMAEWSGPFNPTQPMPMRLGTLPYYVWYSDDRTGLRSRCSKWDTTSIDRLYVTFTSFAHQYNANTTLRLSCWQHYKKGVNRILWNDCERNYDDLNTAGACTHRHSCTPVFYESSCTAWRIEPGPPEIPDWEFPGNYQKMSKRKFNLFFFWWHSDLGKGKVWDSQTSPTPRPLVSFDHSSSHECTNFIILVVYEQTK